LQAVRLLTAFHPTRLAPHPDGVYLEFKVARSLTGTLSTTDKRRPPPVPQNAPTSKEVAESESKIAVVIPCYRETAHIMSVIESIGDEVSQIFVIDDACPDHTGKYVLANCTDGRVKVLTHGQNTGVGGATLTGYKSAIESGANIIVKLDGDGQMDPAHIEDLVKPLRQGDADYAKGNRFFNLDGLSRMPKTRILGNLLLSFASKVSSGYWNVFDPTNGYTAIRSNVAQHLPFDKLDQGFFFESDMLFRLYLLRAVVADIPMPANYGNEKSSLKIRNVIFSFTIKHWINTTKRIFYTYFLRDFGVASIELVLGKIMLLCGMAYGVYGWHGSSVSGVPATAGTVLLAALPVILGTQFLIGFIDHDTRNVPTKPLR